MDIKDVSFPIVALFKKCMDIRTISTRKYPDASEMFTEALSHLGGMAHALDEKLDQLEKDPDFKGRSKDDIIQASTNGIIPLIGEFKELPNGVRQTALLMLIVLEGGISLRDILDDEEVAKINAVVNSLEPQLRKLHEMKEAGDEEGAMRLMEEMSENMAQNIMGDKKESVKDLIAKARKFTSNNKE